MIYQLFLQAFHAEFEFLQQAIAEDKIGLEDAGQMQQQIIYDEMAYLNNGDGFVKK
ncbi:hypothetical protein ABTQ33_03755 [Paucilactobacillus suebicus]|uniref:Uncharacterized protein n=1 Tax=Paucilactobacillus suebicus DSM 5007 = KCTC 3549 TaxID=1423807 RepID=A0A0R1W744_9LACO|nr:hypothetical protein [Paucilactobacillus suebicus]KRM13295.1 hypothetical protein FD16_GL000770 [Paucilactobacillus suebicus DSM 5007 = KCTC 3549]